MTKEINNINQTKLACGKNVVSLMIESMKVSEVVKGNYNFGGLVHREASQEESS